MNKLSLEQKAKAYDEAVINGSRLWECGEITRESYEYIFPELKESEEERMIQYFKDLAPFDKAEELYEKYGFSHKDAIAWLEKQGKNSMGVSEATKQKLKDNLHKALAKETPESCNEFLDEQKPADKVEQKFHEGDMIIHKELGGDYIHTPHKIIQVDMLDKKYRLEGGLVAHFCEQDDYELVEQKPDDTEKGEKGNDMEIPIPEPPLTIKHAREVMGIKQDTAWSEEDKVKINRIVACLENLNVADNDILLKDVAWLKSIKNRVQPQSKQEWSEDDESYLNTTIVYLKDAKEFKKTAENCINWLKSLKDRYTWKPSDEQLERHKGNMRPVCFSRS